MESDKLQLGHGLARLLYVGGLMLVLAGCAGSPSEESAAEDAVSAGTVAQDADGQAQSTDTDPAQNADEAAVTEASFTGEPGAYQVSVTVTSPDTGCDQYADWWEVLSAEGELLYRRILAHSHVDEQPFTRSGGPVAISPTDPITIRVHMNNTGYSSQVLSGTVEDGLTPTTLLIDPEYDATVSQQPPQPSGCAF